jgi:hypothetical protein
MVRAFVVGVVAGRDEDHGQPRGVSPGDAVTRRERTDVHGGDDRPAAVDPGIACHGVGRIELVTATDLLHVLVFEKLVQ